MRYYPAPSLPLTLIRDLDRQSLAQLTINLWSEQRIAPDTSLIQRFRNLRTEMFDRQSAATTAVGPEIALAVVRELSGMTTEDLVERIAPEANKAAQRSPDDPSKAYRAITANGILRNRGF